MVRAAYLDKNGVTKGAWSKEEDNRLRDYVLQFGHLNWRLVPKYAGLNRCGKSCRLRWMNYLKPDVKRGNFSREEGELIKSLYDEHGSKWSLIATNFPRRTDNEIKNYWHTHFNANKRNRRNMLATKISKEKPSRPNLSEILQEIEGEKKPEEMPCDDQVHILESSSSSLSRRSNSGVSFDFELESIVDEDWSEMLSQPSHCLGYNWGSEDGRRCSSSEFQESFVVDPSYIQEIEFSLLDDFESSLNQVLGFEFDDGNDFYYFKLEE